MNRMDPEEWEHLDTRRPRLGIDAVASAAGRLFGIHGRPSLLAEEREQVFSLVTPLATFVARVSCGDATLESTVIQNQALEAVAQSDPSLPVPRVLRSISGLAVEKLRDGRDEYQLRLLSYLPGRPLFGPRQFEALRNVGLAAARLARALQSAPVRPVRSPLLWNLQEAHQLLPFVRFVEDTELRALAESVLMDFSTRGLDEFRNFPLQLIHNDLSAKNLLFDEEDQSVITGIIDFGDVVAGPRIADLAIAITRFAHLADPIRSSAEVVAGYVQHSPLTLTELSALYPIACARLAMRIVIWSWRLRNAVSSDATPLREASLLLSDLVALGKDAFVSEIYESLVTLVRK